MSVRWLYSQVEHKKVWTCEAGRPPQHSCGSCDPRPPFIPSSAWRRQVVRARFTSVPDYLTIEPRPSNSESSAVRPFALDRIAHPNNSAKL